MSNVSNDLMATVEYLYTQLSRRVIFVHPRTLRDIKAAPELRAMEDNEVVSLYGLEIIPTVGVPPGEVWLGSIDARGRVSKLI